MALVLEVEKKNPETVGSLRELLAKVPADTDIQVMCSAGVLLQIWRDEETDMRVVHLVDAPKEGD